MILNSITMKVNSTDFEKVYTYCQEHNMKMTSERRNDVNLGWYVVVWGTKEELNNFRAYCWTAS